jgi:ribosomal-protein-alanine N-acetyltransferase
MKNEVIYLRAFELEDYKFLNKLRTDEEMFKLTCGNKYYISSEYDKKWVEDKIFNNNRNVYLAICLKDNSEIIGYTSINDIDYRNRCAMWGAIMIDSKKSGKGCATEVGNILINYVFNELGFKRFHSRILEEHAASLRFVEKLGFTKEGILKSSVYKTGKFHNEIIVALINNK